MSRALLLGFLLPLAVSAQKNFPPLRIVGNLYYVGDNDLASYLIVTPKGDISDQHRIRILCCRDSIAHADSRIPREGHQDSAGYARS